MLIGVFWPRSSWLPELPLLPGSASPLRSATKLGEQLWHVTELLLSPSATAASQSWVSKPLLILLSWQNVGFSCIAYLAVVLVWTARDPETKGLDEVQGVVLKWQVQHGVWGPVLGTSWVSLLAGVNGTNRSFYLLCGGLWRDFLMSITFFLNL